MKKLVKRLVPRRVVALVRRLAAKLAWVIDLRTSTDPALIGRPGPLVTGLFAHIESIPGAFNVDDCGHFHLILTMQSAHGLTGDLLEIGSFHGRSTSVMARSLRDGERILVCDAFELETEDSYDGKPSVEVLLGNVLRVNPTLDRSQVIIHACLSDDLKLDPSQRFRFVHIDGGHSAAQVHADLELCKPHLVPRGVMSIDDYDHRDWPEVTPGVDRWLAANPEFEVIADVNRHGAVGRKLYIMKR